MTTMNGQNLENIKSAVRGFIIEEFLPGEDPSNLLDDTPLISGRILDSLASLRLIEFLEAQFKVEIRPEEMTEEYLDTIESVGALVQSKQ